MIWTFLVGFYQYLSRNDYYIAIVGLENAGKRRVLNKRKRTMFLIIRGPIHLKIIATVGCNIGNARLNFWDKYHAD